MSLARQLDFLANLLPAFRAPPPVSAAPLPLPKSQRDAALEKRAHELLSAISCGDLASRVKIRWNPRMRSTAGTALVSRSVITLNPRLRELGEDEIDRTLRHELAHLLAHERAGRRRISAHGPEWKQACVDLGIPGDKRCHTLPLPRREMTRGFVYRCPACAQEVRRVRPFARKSACLACCRRHNHGRYDDRFRFVKIARPAASEK